MRIALRTWCSIRLRRFFGACAGVALIASLAVPCAAQAAGLRLRTECQCQGPIVTLGDVADIEAAAEERAELAAIELFPAPAEGNRRYVRAREIQDALALQGVNLKRHRLTGSSQVQLVRAAPPVAAPAAAPPPPPKSVNRQLARDISERARKAIVSHLESEATEGEAWQVQVHLTDEQVRQLSVMRGEWLVEGGEEPWTGVQQFYLAADESANAAHLPIAAEVSTPPAVVAVVRALPAGALLHEADLELVPGKPGSWTEPFSAVDSLVGQETRRPVVAGQVLDKNDVRAPVLIRRGDAVTVYARSAGVQVRTTARAQEEGAQGDLISVESLSKRERFFVRVCGVQEAEVFAHGVQTPADDLSRPVVVRRAATPRIAGRAMPGNQEERR